MKNRKRNYEEFQHSWEDINGNERETKVYYKIRFVKDEFCHESYTEVMDWEGDDLSDCELENVEEILNEMLHEGCFEPEMPDCYADLI
jgi:hypothetical protein